MNDIVIKALLYVVHGYADNRYYHTIKHPLSMLDHASIRGVNLSIEQQIAIIFHDYIMFDPLAEEKSADAAYHFTIGNIDASSARKVWQMIVDTKNHVPSIPQSSIVIDLDLEILSMSELIYRLYVADIRNEYQQYSDEQFRTGRSEWIKKFLQRERLFWQLTELEQPARKNLSDELQSYLG